MKRICKSIRIYHPHEVIIVNNRFIKTVETASPTRLLTIGDVSFQIKEYDSEQGYRSDFTLQCQVKDSDDALISKYIKGCILELVDSEGMKIYRGSGDFPVRFIKNKFPNYITIDFSQTQPM